MQLKTTKECICEIGPQKFYDGDVFEKQFLILEIGELVYKNKIANCLFIYNDYDGNRHIDEMTPDIINEMTLGYLDDESELWGIGVKVKEIDDDKIREFLIEAVMEAYAESLCE